MTQQTLISDLPSWVPPEAWAEFLKMRKLLKKPLSEYGQKLALKTLNNLRLAGHDPQAVLDYAIENSNQGLFAPRGAVPQRQQFQTPVEKASQWADGITGRSRSTDSRVIDINDAPPRRIA